MVGHSHRFCLDSHVCSTCATRLLPSLQIDEGLQRSRDGCQDAPRTACPRTCDGRGASAGRAVVTYSQMNVQPAAVSSKHPVSPSWGTGREHPNVCPSAIGHPSKRTGRCATRMSNSTGRVATESPGFPSYSAKIRLHWTVTGGSHVALGAPSVRAAQSLQSVRHRQRYFLTRIPRGSPQEHAPRAQSMRMLQGIQGDASIASSTPTSFCSQQVRTFRPPKLAKALTSAGVVYAELTALSLSLRTFAF